MTSGDGGWGRPPTVATFPPTGIPSSASQVCAGRGAQAGGGVLQPQGAASAWPRHPRPSSRPRLSPVRTPRERGRPGGVPSPSPAPLGPLSTPQRPPVPQPRPAPRPPTLLLPGSASRPPRCGMNKPRPVGSPEAGAAVWGSQWRHGWPFPAGRMWEGGPGSWRGLQLSWG